MRLRAIAAAGSTAGHAAAAMPRRPCRGVQCRTAGGQEMDDVHWRWCGEVNSVEWALVGTAACFSSRGPAMLQRAGKWEAATER